MTDPWEQLCFTTSWIMNNFQPIEDNHYFEIRRQRAEEYQDDLDFYEDREYDDIELYFDNTDDFDNYDEYYDNNEDSSSESDCDDYE
jgi:hypothetical protein